MKPRIWIQSATFSDGTTIEFSKDDIVVFVGPNNSGKSVTLRDLIEKFGNSEGSTKVIQSINKVADGTAEELEEYLGEVSLLKRNSGDPRPFFAGLGYRIYSAYVSRWWNQASRNPEGLTPFFIRLLSTQDRLSITAPVESIRLTTDEITHPIHELQKDDNIEEKFSNYFKQAFGTSLTVHRGGGREVLVYVGDPPALEGSEDRVSRTYLDRLEKLDVLHQQGDGMRGYVGVLLYAFIANYSVFLIDEPEAFLHPPQARLLGKVLAKDLPKERQLFLATHSEDFLKGVLDANVANLKIVRIRRNENVNNVSLLNHDDIKDIWSDSLLRHSNVLAGLFHSSVILCESDSDNRFYSAVLSSIYDGTDSPIPDVLFTHCGGKHRMPVVIRSLRKLNVPVRVIADFDILNDIEPLRAIFTSLGGDWTDVDNDWHVVKDAIDKKRPQLETAELKKQIKEILDGVEERVFPKDKSREIGNLFRKASPWSEAKKVGKSFIPAGDETRAFDRLETKCKSVGLFIVPGGELESWDRTIGNHGPKWVVEVLEKDLNGTEFDEARRFVQQILPE
jgi:ABC-type transport system involved in cytochrome c biogenesis ATPase subunit